MAMYSGPGGASDTSKWIHVTWYEWLLTGYSWHQFEGSEYPNGSESTEVHVHIFIIRELCNEPVEAITSYHYHKLLLILRTNTWIH